MAETRPSGLLPNLPRVTRIGTFLGVVGIFFFAFGPATFGATASGLLTKLAVSSENPTGYDRDKFDLWITVPGKGCGTRRWVLYRQSLTKQRSTSGPESGSKASLASLRSARMSAKLRI